MVEQINNNPVGQAAAPVSQSTSPDDKVAGNALALVASVLGESYALIQKGQPDAMKQELAYIEKSLAQAMQNSSYESALSFWKQLASGLPANDSLGQFAKSQVSAMINDPKLKKLTAKLATDKASLANYQNSDASWNNTKAAMAYMFWCPSYWIAAGIEGAIQLAQNSKQTDVNNDEQELAQIKGNLVGQSANMDRQLEQSAGMTVNNVASATNQSLTALSQMSNLTTVIMANQQIQA